MTSRLLPALLLSSAFTVLAGYSTLTIVTLNDDHEIQAVDTPHYDHNSGFYELEQLDGKRTRINEDQARSIKGM